MRARRIFPLVILAGIFIVSALAAQDQKDTAKPNNARFGDPTSIGRKHQDDLYGMVKEIKDKEIVLDKTKFGVDQTILLESKTKFVRDGKVSSLAQLKVGDLVYVSVKTNKKTGEMTAKRVTSGVTAGP